MPNPTANDPPPIEPTTLNSVARVVMDTLQFRYQIDPAPVAATAGLDAKALNQSRGRVSHTRMNRLWNAAAAATGDPCFGLRAGQRVRPTSFSVVGAAWLASTTLEDALQRLCRYVKVISTVPVGLRLEHNGADARLVFLAPKFLPVPDLAVDAMFAAVLTLSRMVTDPRLKPRHIELRHDGRAKPDVYREVLSCPVSFGAPQDSITFAYGDLQSPLVGRDSELARNSDLAAEQYLRMVDKGQLSAEVGRHLVHRLPAGAVAMDELARNLNRSASTLQRQLQKEGTTYRDVRDEARRLLAERHLSDRELSVGEIAYLLGFTDQGSFSRAFRRWTGISPRQFRERMLTGL